MNKDIVSFSVNLETAFGDPKDNKMKRCYSFFQLFYRLLFSRLQ